MSALLDRAIALANGLDSFHGLLLHKQVGGNTIADGLASMDAHALAALVAELEEEHPDVVEALERMPHVIATPLESLRIPVAGFEFGAEPQPIAMGLLPPADKLDDALQAVVQSAEGHVSLEDWAQLERCIREVRIDASRYRFLRGNDGPTSVRWQRWQVAHWNGVWNPVSGEQLDAAIDAAREPRIKPKVQLGGAS